MPTINQLCRKKRPIKKQRNKVPALNMNPQKKGVCTKIFLRTPKKTKFSFEKVSNFKTYKW